MVKRYDPLAWLILFLVAVACCMPEGDGPDGFTRQSFEGTMSFDNTDAMEGSVEAVVTLKVDGAKATTKIEFGDGDLTYRGFELTLGDIEEEGTIEFAEGCFLATFKSKKYPIEGDVCGCEGETTVLVTVSGAGDKAWALFEATKPIDNYFE